MSDAEALVSLLVELLALLVALALYPHVMDFINRMGVRK